MDSRHARRCAALVDGDVAALQGLRAVGSEYDRLCRTGDRDAGRVALIRPERAVVDHRDRVGVVGDTVPDAGAAPGSGRLRRAGEARDDLAVEVRLVVAAQLELALPEPTRGRHRVKA